jgi:NADH:ubiquinone oxidoreductase subunit E
MKGPWIAGAAVAACVAILLADYIVAGARAPRDEKLIQSLQQQVKSDARQAPVLAAEQKRVTAARQGRKSRDNAVAWVLIAAAALFLIVVPKAAQRRPHPAPRTAVHHAPAGLRPQANAGPPQIDLAFVDELVARQGRSKEAAITLLQAIQTHYRYLPDEALRRLCELTDITPAQIAGTSSFYGQFRRSPVGKHIVRVCHGTACHVSGARQITDEVRRYLGIPEGADTDDARMFTVEEVACVGCCSLAPVLTVDGRTAGRLTPSSACAALQPCAEAEKETA